MFSLFHFSNIQNAVARFSIDVTLFKVTLRKNFVLKGADSFPLISNMAKLMHFMQIWRTKKTKKKSCKTMAYYDTTIIYVEHT